MYMMISCISMYMRFMHNDGHHITRPQRCANARTWSSSVTIATTFTICGVSGPKVACESAQLGE
jgi:hypothetical protein